MIQEPFEPEAFVEKLAKRTMQVSFKDNDKDQLDPIALQETFLQAIKDLQMLQERQFRKCARLEQQCQEEEHGHWQEVAQLQDKNKAAVGMFQDLDERINYVATKVIHLGDQLESVNTPRSRAVEAQRLMSHFAEFLSSGPITLDVFLNKSQIDEAADIIQKLHLIAQELPSDKFEGAKKKIASKYDEIEKLLIEAFVTAHEQEDTARMKEIAAILSHFKGYTQCVDAFIEQSQMSTLVGKNVFRDVIPLCRKNYDIMKEVFLNPEQVMAKFILNIYHGKLQNHIVTILADKKDTSLYLENLHELYSRTVQLSNDLMMFDMGNDEMFLSKLTQNIFQKYLENYIGMELRNLKECSVASIQNFYDSKSHHKRQIQTGGFQDLRRDLQAVIGTRANINIAQIDDYGGETFLSMEVAKSLLQTGKQAFKRCTVLSKQSDQAAHAQLIFDVLLNQLLAEYVDYALELGLQAVPIPETKVQPQLYFLQVASQTNEIVHFLDMETLQSLLPIVVSTPKHTECLNKKRQMLEQIESKLDTGLDRILSAVVGWVKIYLQTEQKKTDFKPEADLDTMASPACLVVVQYISNTIKRIKSCLDGKNAECVLLELGIRLHRVIYEHLQQFQFNSVGAMIAIMDVNEYRKCVKDLQIPLVNTLFDTLHALCNLLLVKPENLKQVCSGETLAGLDNSILVNFIQLRTDYKTQKLATSLKGLTA